MSAQEYYQGGGGGGGYPQQPQAVSKTYHLQTSLCACVTGKEESGNH
jgi:hypothetical protein